MRSQKFDRLIAFLKQYSNCAVLYSGGVDSFFLLYAALQALGKENVTAVTMKTAFVSKSEFEIATRGIRELDAQHRVFDLDIFQDPDAVRNDEKRCYYCKRFMLKNVLKQLHGFDVVMDGTNKSDAKDYRPGAVALAENHIVSPLKEVGYEKAEIMEDLRQAGFEAFVRPADACLATRICQGEKLTKHKLEQTQCAEQYIKQFDCTLVRVRMIGSDANIELLPEEIERFRPHLDEVRSYFIKTLGYRNVTLSEKGYVRGSMNKGTT